MITAFLLLPVLAVLLWLYWYLLGEQRPWNLFDSVLLLILLAVSVAWHFYILGQDWQGAGPLWPQVLSVMGAYGILAIGLALGLWWRKR